MDLTSNFTDFQVIGHHNVDYGNQHLLHSLSDARGFFYVLARYSIPQQYRQKYILFHRKQKVYLF